jgi:hypothetical protein
LLVAITKHLKLGDKKKKEVYLPHSFVGPGAWQQHLLGSDEGPLGYTTL